MHRRTRRESHDVASRRAWRWTAALAVLCLTVAACGDDDGEASSAPDDLSAVDDSTLSPEVAKAAAKAEELGLRFATSREEIMAGAEAEGALDAIWSLGTEDAAADYLDLFSESEPSVEIGEITGMSSTEERQRFLLELEAGAPPGVGYLYLATEVYSELASLCDWDIYGMAEAGILDIPLEVIDPVERTIVSSGSAPGVFAYNIDAFADRELPTSWEDLLKPEYSRESGFNMLGDIRNTVTSSMVPAWGLDRLLEYWEDFAAQDPIWVTNAGTPVVQMDQGEYDAMPFVSLHSIWARMTDAPPNGIIDGGTEGSSMGVHFIEPVPIRLTDTHCVTNDEMNSTPYSALLFMEWEVSEAGQSIRESHENGKPWESQYHLDYPGGVNDVLESLGGLEPSIVTFDDLRHQGEYIEELSRVAGLPQPIQ